MATRGRKSAASLSIVAGTIGTRPDPPKHLSTFQKEVWRRTVAAEAAAFFKTAALQQGLVEYCRHVQSAHTLSVAISELEAGDAALTPDRIGEYADLLKLRDRETRAVMDKATKLRLTNQARYTPAAAATAAKNAGEARKPWETAV